MVDLLHLEDLYILIQAALALLFGGLIGWEREHSGKWAGLRTHMLICFSATMIVRVGLLLIDYVDKRVAFDILRNDPIRIIEAIISGIAFLGAGTVFRDPDAERMRGLTTAASMLAVASIGIAIAVERYALALGMTLLVLFVLHVMDRFEQRWFDKAR